MLPRSTCPVSGSSPSTERQVSVLPEPDSPTRPTDSPRRISKETSRTATRWSPTLTWSSSTRSMSPETGPGVGPGTRSAIGSSSDTAVLLGDDDGPSRKRYAERRVVAAADRAADQPAALADLAGRGLADAVRQDVERADGEHQEHAGEERRPRLLLEEAEVGGEHPAPC